MVEIKSYTDLEQSRKLAEFIPRETADMHYDHIHRIRLGVSSVGTPCWSLAALIDLLPQHITLQGAYMPLVMDKDNMCFVGYNGRYSYRGAKNENFVDSCVEMILRLHEMGYKEWPRK